LKREKNQLMFLKSVTYVPEHLLPFSMVCTGSQRGEQNRRIDNTGEQPIITGQGGISGADQGNMIRPINVLQGKAQGNIRSHRPTSARSFAAYAN
jgi:hypothetical protein